MNIRIGNEADLMFIREMLFEAFFWDLEIPRSNLDKFFANPEYKKLLLGWGRLGDKSFVAEEGQRPIGAAWYRLWDEENHSYGFIDSNTPELGIGVKAKYRSKGVGRLLLRALIKSACDDGFKALSLSVDPSNFARQLYESEGFVKDGESGTSWTLKLEL